MVRNGGRRIRPSDPTPVTAADVARPKWKSIRRSRRAHIPERQPPGAPFGEFLFPAARRAQLRITTQDDCAKSTALVGGRQRYFRHRMRDPDRRLRRPLWLRRCRFVSQQQLQSRKLGFQIGVLSQLGSQISLNRRQPPFDVLHFRNSIAFCSAK
jgi:hypothetical protein